MPAELAELVARLGHRFARPELLEQALTHPSRASDDWGDRDRGNERLEFLGDAVLGLVIAEQLMDANPGANEGGLSQARARMVNQAALAARARALGLEDLVRLGKGTRQQGGRFADSILANAFEAVLGALYLDGGLEAARRFLRQELAAELAEPAGGPLDAKSALQEELQALGRPAPAYAVVETLGPPHAPEFAVEVRIGASVLGTGRGASKRAAEQAAARAGLSALNTRES